MKVSKAIVGFLLVTGALASASATGRSEQPVSGLVNNIVQHTMPAADFTLTDQHSLPFHLADSRGKVVVMSFICTHCTDICPFIAVKVRDAYKLRSHHRRSMPSPSSTMPASFFDTFVTVLCKIQ